MEPLARSVPAEHRWIELSDGRVTVYGVCPPGPFQRCRIEHRLACSADRPARRKHAPSGPPAAFIPRAPAGRRVEHLDPRSRRRLRIRQDPALSITAAYGVFGHLIQGAPGRIRTCAHGPEGL
ncbi:DUF6083 domain-containing protein [Streptomyces sp. NPDC001652]|uniref:DUF6083 domain-containing protein n=1 Tax=Streptomyces sp. NPDC001652 TaxID=3154393 RepID=UPI00332E9F6C